MPIDIASEELYLNIKKMVSRKVSALEDQDDIVQEILLKIIKYAKLDESASFFSWLKLAVRSSIGDHYRKSMQHHIRIEDENLIPDMSEKESQSDLVDCIHPFLNKMDASDAQLIQEIDLNGRSQKEIARELKLNYSTLKSRLQKARKSLAMKIAHCCEEIKVAKNCC